MHPRSRRINMSKTMLQHVHKRQAIKRQAQKKKQRKGNTNTNVTSARGGLKRKTTCLIKHRSHCVYNYNTTSEVFEIEKIVDVFGYTHSRWFLVK